MTRTSDVKTKTDEEQTSEVVKRYIFPSPC